MCQRFEEREKDMKWFLLKCGKPPDDRRGAALLQEGTGLHCLSSAPDAETVRPSLDPRACYVLDLEPYATFLVGWSLSFFSFCILIMRAPPTSFQGKSMCQSASWPVEPCIS